MTEKLTTVKADRRGFLKLAGIGTVASGAALISGEAAKAKSASDQPSADGDATYKETEHVKTFYDSARF